ncbi:unnamed protein product [Allacma fusca]|uniref:Methyltransferase FkbM domain-containing protein n=1 Tax=Allacma fusca TaxID=39272 RepID=A0A8J2JUK3_9HEXA|nr:unnamed protein product [Allacma fusca]
MEKLRNIKNRTIQDLRSAHAQLSTDPLLKKLVIIFLLVFVSQMIILQVVFPSDYGYWIPPPVKIPFPSKPSTIQDRFEYSFKDLRAQMNEELITKIKAQINPPPEKADPSDMVEFPQTLLSEFFEAVRQRVHEILRYKRNGFFVEYGDWGGLDDPYTRFFERVANFTGLIIEPDPNVFERIMKAGRNVWTINSGLSIHPNENQQTFIRPSQRGERIMLEFAKGVNKENMNSFNLFNATCFPLTSILLAIKKGSIDLLYLEMDGAELNIFKTIAWAQIDINVVLVVETDNRNDKKDSMEKYLVRQGFAPRGIIPGPWLTAYIFQNSKYI